MSELNEAAQVRDETQRLIDILGGAGITERSIVVGMQMALAERLLLSSGTEGAKRFFSNQAAQVEEWGDAFLKAAKG